MSKSLTVKTFITLSCEAIECVSKEDAQQTYKSIKENKNGIWCKFNEVLNALSLKVELNEQIEELEEEIDDNPDEKQQYISKISTLLSSPITIKLIHDLEVGFNKNHGTFAKISDNYNVDIPQLQNYKPTTPKKPKETQPSKAKKKKKKKTETQKKQKSNKKNSKSNSKKLNRQKSKNGSKKNTKTPSNKPKKRKNESASKCKRNKKAKKAAKMSKFHRRSSTMEDIRHGKLQKKKQKDKKSKKNKKTKKKNMPKSSQPKSPKSPKPPESVPSPETPKYEISLPTAPISAENPNVYMSPSTSATDMYDEKTNISMLENTEMQSAENESDEHEVISTQSQNMGRAFALFERLSSPKAHTADSGVFGSDSEPALTATTPTKKVTKKGKRYTDFVAFSSGAFSIVYKAKDKENGTKIVAVKKIHIGGNTDKKGFEPTTKEEGDNEVRILKLLNGHCNTCNLIDTYFDMKLGMNMGYILCIVMEYMQFTLKDRMDYYGEKGKCIPFHLIKIYLFQLCKAVSFMHVKNVCHRDLKPENVLINIKTNRLQICDFGCSIVLGTNEYNDDEKYQYQENEDGNETYIMSRFYRPPELILGNALYDCSADIWSLGVVISELFLGTILFMGSSNLDQLREIILKLGWPTKQEICGMNPAITQFDKIAGVYGVDETTVGESFNMIFMGVMDMEESAVDLISKLLVYSPDERFTATQCLQHAYFDKVQSLMAKSNKKMKTNKKRKKDAIVPNDLFDWNEIETKYAKSKNIILRK